MKPIRKKFVGVLLIILGFAIIITPFTPGSILFVIGLDMLFGDRWPWWNGVKRKARVLLKRVFKVKTKI